VVKSDELTLEQVKVTKVDPNQKTFEEYQKEKKGKKEEPKKEEAKKEEVKKAPGALDKESLFKTDVNAKTTTKKVDNGGNKKTKSVPKVTDQKDFPTLK